MNRIGILLLLLISIGSWSCQTIGIKKTGSEARTKEGQRDHQLQTELKDVDQLINFARRAEMISDTLGADFYYRQALHRLDSLETKFDPDSSLIIKRSEVGRLYETFLAAFSLQSDTVSTDEVIEDLSLINEEIDSSAIDGDTVSIADVIDESHELKIPLVLNQRVERTIEYFTKGKGRKVFEVWLKRSGKYEQLIKTILKEEDVPEELFYLAMIESGFRPHARSWAKAVGIWQFIYGTGAMYGLKASWWFDERRDPAKSTRAAALHLKDLYERFGDWYLAMAGYNYSPGKIQQRLSRYGISNYWDLPRLPRETRNYVPTFIAAATIAQNREKYGFDNIDLESPLVFDTVTVRECVDLNVVSQCVNSTFTEIKDLNPALLRWCTPPDRESWVLNLPVGTREIFLQNYAKIPDNEKLSWIRHRIRSGETLSSISMKYGVSISEIKRFNNIRGTFIRAGASLVIPVPQHKDYYKRYANYSNSRTSSRPLPKVENVPGRGKHVYLVKKGDTLWKIAQLFGVSVSEVQKWNGLGYSSRIYPNQKLNIWLLPDKAVTQSVLAEQETTVEASSAEAPGGSTPEQRSIVYEVRPGDTLWDISQTFNVSIRDIKAWNKKRSNIIKPGEKLNIITTVQ